MKLFYEGQTAFSYLWSAMEEAEQSIDIRMFIWRDDVLGRKMLDAVRAADQRGIDVRIKKDWLGSVFELAEESRASLIHDKVPLKGWLTALWMHGFYPMAGKPRRAKLAGADIFAGTNIQCDPHDMRSDHSKSILLDERLFIVSGMNFENKEYDQDLLGRKYFDYMLAVDLNDHTLMEAPLSIERNLLEVSEDLDMIQNTDGLFHVKPGIMSRIRQARSELTIVMAYIGYQEITDALIEKCNEGVQLTLYLPIKANLQSDLNLKVASQLYERTGGKIRIFLCQEMIHAKLIMVDDDYVTFGSANLNRQALEVLGETNIGFFSKVHGLHDDIHASMEAIRKASIEVRSQEDLKYNRLRAFLEGLV